MSSEEFENIKDNIAYFDWNIIHYLYHPENLSPDLARKIFCLSYLLRKVIIRDRWAFPFSQAHLQDIAQGSSDLIELKLKLLDHFSRGWLIHEDFNQNFALRMDKPTNIQDYYNWFIDANEASNSMTEKTFESIKPIIEQTAEYLRSQASKYPESSYTEFLFKLADSLLSEDAGLEAHRILKEIKKQGLKDGTIRFPQVDKKVVDLQNDDLHVEINKALSKSNIPISSYEEYIAMFHPKEIDLLSEFQNQILKLTGFADYVGLASENFKKSTAFKSMTTDQRHLSCGLKCRFFITADKNLLQKAKFIKTWLNLDILIFDIDEFVIFILKQNLRQMNIENPNPINNLTYNFCDDEGKIVHSYQIVI
ncbi:hypothetical protein [Leptospira licerasiae]|uniref:hypothetical protein n=1 Tax=Leptospira licerasiae TaxID=447106 RepID=UPI0010841060|nr:hypothetical protein [Leptospira licerasiae]TGM88719.1 hypothetical protein EHR05_10930 [Leptospira licerasiae]